MPTPSPAPTPTPTQAPTPTQTPGPTPETASSIIDVRSLPVGSRVHVRGVVTAEPGRIGTAGLFTIADATGGLVVRLPSGSGGIGRGTLVDVSGPLAAPYGQLEVRPSASGLAIVGTAPLPAPIAISALDLGESAEASLVTIDVTLDRAPSRSSSGDISTSALDPATGRRLTVMADASSGLVTSDLARGARAHLAGIVGQRATRVGRLDGYRIWVRDRADIVRTATPGRHAHAGARLGRRRDTDTRADGPDDPRSPLRSFARAPTFGSRARSRPPTISSIVTAES